MNEAQQIIALLEGYKREYVEKIKEFFRECITLYFKPEYIDAFFLKTEPSFKIKEKHGKSGWFSQRENTIYIHPDILTDNILLRKIVFHKTIHYIDYKNSGEILGDGHGDFFKMWRDKINEKEGTDYITILQENHISRKTLKPYYVHYTLNTITGDIHFFWSKKTNERVQQKLKSVAKEEAADKMFVLKTNNAFFKIGSPPVTGATRKFLTGSLAKNNPNAQEEEAYKLLIDNENALELK